MKKKIRTTAIILGFALAFSGICGCGGDPVNVNVNVNTDDQNEGKGDLITDEDQSADGSEEEQAAQEEANIKNELVIRGAAYMGLENLRNENNDDGTYFYEDMTEDGITVITNMSAPNSQRDGQDPDAYAENFVCALIDNDARITETKEDEKLTGSFTYPVYRILWESGSNEDSRQAVGVVVLTDLYTYYYGFKCSVDYYEDNADFYDSELENLELVSIDAPEEEGTAGTEGSDKAYAGLYLEKINELKAEGKADQFALENIDDDDIPELIASDSKGSFDHENAFIFTIYNDEAVLLASVIAGVDGGNLDYKKGDNLIHISGAAAGMRDVFSKIKDGKLEEVFSAEASSMDEDAKYSVNGKNVKEAEYYEQINGFVEPYDPLTRISYDGLYEISYKYEDGYGYFDQGSFDKYSSSEEISKELK